MKVCPKCNYCYIAHDDNFCTRDGEELAASKFHECGRMIFPSEKFCAKCGKPVNQEVKP